MSDIKDVRKRPRISKENYKYFKKIAVDNETTTEYEIDKALERIIRDNDRKKIK